ncbi:hypothetical protein [Streptomyces sp. NPDC005805]|uniref:hypothetical protein n=1 Tax=Streptomyces sp. NPDC005805 TaxID=3157068 RepID=UPI0033EBFA50
MRIRNRATALTSATAIAAGVLFTAVAAAPAQAYSPNPTTYITRQVTDNCPCTYGDLIDGTYFQKDVGGTAVKIMGTVGKPSNIVGKVEFHPQGEKLWIYDTKNDGDALYVRVEYTIDGSLRSTDMYKAPGTPKEIDVRTVDLNLPEGTFVTVLWYDDADGDDLIAVGRGRA